MQAPITRAYLHLARLGRSLVLSAGHRNDLQHWAILIDCVPAHDDDRACATLLRSPRRIESRLVYVPSHHVIVAGREAHCDRAYQGTPGKSGVGRCGREDSLSNRPHRPVSNPPEHSRRETLPPGYFAVFDVAGVQKRSKARVRSSVMERGSRPSISDLSSMNTSFPSRRSATEGDDGG